MDFEKFLESTAIQNYFGKGYANWKPDFEAIIKKSNLAGTSIDDPISKRALIFTPCFSWMALIFNGLWITYHRGKNGIFITLAIYVIVLFGPVINLGILPTILGVLITVLFGIYGKSYILASKAEEFSNTESLAPPSLTRAVFVLIVGVVLSIVSTVMIVVTSL